MRPPGLFYWEKVPFALLSLFAAVVAFFPHALIGDMASPGEAGRSGAVDGLSLWFMVLFLEDRGALQTFAAVRAAESGGVMDASFHVKLRCCYPGDSARLGLWRRLPGVGIAGLAYSATLLPVLGIFHNGPQIVADRYSYLACMGWAVLAGAGGQYLWQASVDGRIHKRTFLLGSWLSAVLLFGLGLLTWRQTQVWHDPERLWNHVLSTTGESLFARIQS